MPQQGGAGSQNPTIISLGRISPEVWDDLVAIGLSGANGITAPPSLDTFIGGTRLQNYSATTDKEQFFAWQAHHGVKLGTDFQPHVHFVCPNNNAGTVRWGFEYTYADIGAVFGSTTTIYAEKAVTGDQNRHLLAGFDPDIVAPFAEVSGYIVGRVFRDADHANDTYGSACWLLGCDHHVQLDTFGSDSATTKY